MRIASLVLLVVALLLVGAGCGGGDDEAADDTEITVTDTTTEDTDTEATETDDLDTSGLDLFASEDCLQLITIGAAIAQAFSGQGGTDDETADLFEELVAKAPDEIADDLRTVADAYDEWAAAFADLDLEEGQIPSAADLQAIQAAAASIDQAEAQAAAQRLSTWAETNCPGG